jgi:hypothetical protein
MRGAEYPGTIHGLSHNRAFDLIAHANATKQGTDAFHDAFHATKQGTDAFPLALAAAIGLEPGDEVQWELLERGELHLIRIKTAALAAKSKSRKPYHPPT